MTATFEASARTAESTSAGRSRTRTHHYRGPLRPSGGNLVARYVVLGVVAVLFLIPFWVLIKISLMTNDDISKPNFVFLPIPPHVENYLTVLGDPGFQQALLGSVVMAVVSTTLTIAIAAMAGYGLARVPSRLSKPVFALTLLVLMVPSATTFIPNYIIVASFGWVGTLQGLIIPTLFAAFTVFLFRQAFLNFPRELEEAGKLDGLRHFGVFLRIVMPNQIAFVASLTVLGFVGNWNSFLWPLVISGDGFGITTLQVYLSTFLTAQTFDYTGLFATAVLSMVPLVIVFFTMQRFLVRGIAETGMTG
ncbi:carbohydrate ABC transporter permease [Amnibacterium kyonggiense]|uniref:Multiple sugar transport system permease protein n=1 Tax=Amnibacterium kyonggiense TaxID=595671 RepID=A0A4V3EB77_9MICO|nr:carbohydrate ABC transporter permease [Amnibacterium kyonggiense]TDS80634.1 multiple sugar transport system permease protein [Amnibacterium kyonggiense]